MTSRTLPRRLLVLMTEVEDGDVLGRGCNAFVVAPALNSRVRHWVSDVDGARRDAATRLRRCVGHLQESGIDAGGVVGDSDPLLAIADALCSFPADELVIATAPDQRTHLAGRRLVERARARFGLPVRLSLAPQPKDRWLDRQHVLVDQVPAH